MRFLFLFIAPILALLANPFTTVTENDPSTLVDGVSVITGDFYVGEEDYCVAGAEPIPIRRFYLSAIGGIHQYPHLTATFVFSSDQLIVNEPNGTPVIYSADASNQFRGQIGDEFYGKKKHLLKYHSLQFANTSPGIANTSTGSISAKSQLKNQTIIFDPSSDHKGKSFSLYASDGTKRCYVNYLSQEKSDLGPYGKAYFVYYYKLISETLPNGRILHYEWDHKNRLIGMRTSNPQNTKTLAKLPFPQLDLKNLDSYSLQGSDGRSASYIYRQIGKNNFEFAQAISPEQADQCFEYSSNRLCQISLPRGRTIKVEYDGSKVAKLLSPLGPDGTLIPYYTFSYNEGAKTSSSIDALGNQISYSWNNEYRITRIERFEGKQTKKNSETFVWEGTNLKAKVFYDETDTPLFAKTFGYDAKGNVLEEILWGNLSGRGSSLHIDTSTLPVDDGVEKAITKNSYDARNLLIKKEEPNGLITEYTYLSHAQLCSSKTLIANGQVLSKTTYSYDADNTLIREVIEEGKRVCKIKEIIPRQTEPYIALPDWVIEKYIENGAEKLLQKTKLYYTNGALVSQKDIYDASGKFQYSLRYKYDAKGRIQEERNAIDQRAICYYDEVGNKIYERNFSERIEITFDYDLNNRLIRKVEKGFDGIQREFHYSYDQKHNLSSATDAYGNTTLYEHDLFGHTTKTIFPLQRTWNGSSRSAFTQTHYDSMGNPISHIDGEGNETKTAYNIFGKPIRITYADGAVEENIYNLDGTLAKHIDPLGIETAYQYDSLGHVIEKKTEDAVEVFVYDANLLIESIDAEGAKTVYCYDGVGRRIAEETAGKRVEFTYDNLGRIASQIEGNLITTYQYDFLNRILEETKTDPLGHLLQITQYSYDSAGNQAAITQGKNSTERFTYDSFNRLIQKTNPLGAVEVIDYQVSQNDLGQNVLQKTTTDSLGLQTIERFDAQQRTVFSEKRKGKSFLIENIFYNLNGQKIAQEEHIYGLDGLKREILNEWEYDARDRLTTLIEGNRSKITKYKYNPRGEKVTVIKPDNITLTYEYNCLGHLTHLFSSDKTVDHQLNVDKLGRLIHFDGITRALNAQGQILKEYFPNGPNIENRYDPQGRKTKYLIPFFDIEIEYKYGPLELEHVTFQDHTHFYTTYDLAGNLMEEILMGSLGNLTHTYDLAQRPLSLKSPHFYQMIEEYDAIGNILQMNTNGVKQTYAYDELYQLISETGAFCHRYAFDALYNRISKDHENYVLNPLNQAISHCEYDLNGNPTQIGSIRLAYDALDRLIGVETPKRTQTYVYDYLNRRLSQTTEEGKTSHFLYDGQNEVGSFAETLRDFRVLGRTESAEIGASVFMLIDQALYAPIHDLQGNLAMLIPLDQSQASSYRYSAFGDEKLEGPTTSPWRFSSKRVDPLTGFVNYGRRYYLPILGRWLTPDPMGFTAGMNLYAFVQNDPLVRFDEYGLIDYGQYDKQWKDHSERLNAALTHEVGSQVLDLGRFFASSPYQLEKGFNYLTGRQNNAFATWQERQNRFFNRAENWMYQVLPAERNHPDYLMYRRGIGTGIEIGSLAAGGYGLLKGGMKAARGGANVWKIRRGTFVAGEKLTGISQHVKAIQTNQFSLQLPTGHMWQNSSPFKNRTAEEIHQLFLKKGFEFRGRDPIKGYGNYINPKNGRQYHIDPKNHGRYQEPSHIDISRLKNYTGPLKKKRFNYADN